jgi:hypothetical protein
MTTLSSEWMSAWEAISLLPHGTRAICSHAKAELVRARARLLIWGDERRSNADVPSGFWWAEGDEALTQDWRTGHFETYLNHGSLRVQAFGVEFRRSDIEQLKPVTAAKARPPSGAGVLSSVPSGAGVLSSVEQTSPRMQRMRSHCSLEKFSWRTSFFINALTAGAICSRNFKRKQKAFRSPSSS